MCVCVSLMVIAYPFKIVCADEGSSLTTESRIDNYISGIYSQIDFGKYSKINYEVFNKAYRGYLNLKNAGKLSSDKEVLSVCDFSMASTESRLWIIDLAAKKVLFNTYVAHGAGSGEDFATSFSNKENSHQSSLGFYVTGETYNGEHGTSLRLDGQDHGFNDAAMERGIVVHAADYVSDRFVKGNDRLGRSWGCPAVPAKLSMPIINTIKEGTCLFIYAPEKKYLGTAFWLNKKITTLPEQSMFANLDAKDVANAPRTRRIEYVSNGKIDSVKVIPVGQTSLN